MCFVFTVINIPGDQIRHASEQITSVCFILLEKTIDNYFSHKTR